MQSRGGRKRFMSGNDECQDCLTELLPRRRVPFAFLTSNARPTPTMVESGILESELSFRILLKAIAHDHAMNAFVSGCCWQSKMHY